MHDSVVEGNLPGGGRIGLLAPTRTNVFSFHLNLQPRVKLLWCEAGRSLQSKVRKKTRAAMSLIAHRPIMSSLFDA